MDPFANLSQEDDVRLSTVVIENFYLSTGTPLILSKTMRDHCASIGIDITHTIEQQRIP